jgi:hypothetical protein
MSSGQPLDKTFPVSPYNFSQQALFYVEDDLQSRRVVIRAPTIYIVHKSISTGILLPALRGDILILA